MPPSTHFLYRPSRRSISGWSRGTENSSSLCHSGPDICSSTDSPTARPRSAPSNACGSSAQQQSAQGCGQVCPHTQVEHGKCVEQQHGWHTELPLCRVCMYAWHLTTAHNIARGQRHARAQWYSTCGVGGSRRRTRQLPFARNAAAAHDSCFAAAAAAPTPWSYCGCH